MSTDVTRGASLPVHPPRRSMRDVALAASVSVGTVSNVLNNPGIVAATTRERVLQAIDELGFVRNESARQLRAGRSRMVGLVVLDVGNPFYTDVARGVEEVAAAAGAGVVLCTSDEDAAREARYLEMLEEQRVQGVLVTPVDRNDPRLTRLRRRGTPVVLLDRRPPGDAGCSVSVDDVRGGRVATEHLLERGHECIAFVGGTTALSSVHDRMTGARAALVDAGADDLVVLPAPGLNTAGGRAAAAELASLPAGRRPTALLCANDVVALGALQELLRLGLSVPQDVAVVGYDDIEFASAASVPLSSVRQPRRVLGRSAAELLLEEAGSPESHQHRELLFPPELVVRESSDRQRRRRRPPKRAT